MKHQKPTDATRERAMFHALGMLTDEEARDFEGHLAGGCPACEKDSRTSANVVGSLAFALAPARPAKNLRDRLDLRLNAEPQGASQPSAGVQVWKRWDTGGAEPSFVLVHSNQGGWEETGITGIRVRRLFVDAPNHRITMLVRMDAGKSYPSHRHAGIEECYVLEGDLHVGEEVMVAGDYQRAELESVHPVQWTEKGCLLLVTSSQDDKLIPS